MLSRSDNLQSTPRREYRSSTTARYSQPSGIYKYVLSLSQIH